MRFENPFYPQADVRTHKIVPWARCCQRQLCVVWLVAPTRPVSIDPVSLPGFVAYVDPPAALG